MAGNIARYHSLNCKIMDRYTVSEYRDDYKGYHIRSLIPMYKDAMQRKEEIEECMASQKGKTYKMYLGENAYYMLSETEKMIQALTEELIARKYVIAKIKWKGKTATNYGKKKSQ